MNIHQDHTVGTIGESRIDTETEKTDTPRLTQVSVLFKERGYCHIVEGELMFQRLLVSFDIVAYEKRVALILARQT
ncbi:MAG: hypothetical protein KZQ73_10425 [Candidatus Thiodiazotropha sp. (ex Semelilucina semeliformis)]|nr:hypothetical protein [Candidatus Thiodiazotropha sp. (ex Semelilucina semeliformis)]